GFQSSAPPTAQATSTGTGESFRRHAWNDTVPARGATKFIASSSTPLVGKTRREEEASQQSMLVPPFSAIFTGALHAGSPRRQKRKITKIAARLAINPAGLAESSVVRGAEMSDI